MEKILPKGNSKNLTRPDMPKKSVDEMLVSEILDNLKKHKKYKGKTDSAIKRAIGGDSPATKAQLRDELMKLRKKKAAKKAVKKPKKPKVKSVDEEETITMSEGEIEEIMKARKPSSPKKKSVKKRKTPARRPEDTTDWFKEKTPPRKPRVYRPKKSPKKVKTSPVRKSPIGKSPSIYILLMWDEENSKKGGHPTNVLTATTLSRLRNELRDFINEYTAEDMNLKEKDFDELKEYTVNNFDSPSFNPIGLHFMYSMMFIKTNTDKFLSCFEGQKR